jgi:hypothetical protein
MKILTASARPRNPDDPLDPAFNPDEKPSIPELEPDDAPFPDQPPEVPPASTPLTMFRKFAIAAPAGRALGPRDWHVGNARFWLLLAPAGPTRGVT